MTIHISVFQFYPQFLLFPAAAPFRFVCEKPENVRRGASASVRFRRIGSACVKNLYASCHMKNHIAFWGFRKKSEEPEGSSLKSVSGIFLIVLPENPLDFLLGLHDLVVKAFSRDADSPVAEDDELL